MRTPLAAVIRKGLSNLSAKPTALAKSARFRVRIWYRSEGGEIVAMDSGLLRSDAVDALRWQCSRTDSDALAVATIGQDGVVRDARVFTRGMLGQAGFSGRASRTLTAQWPEEYRTARVVSVAATYERIEEPEADQLSIAA